MANCITHRPSISTLDIPALPSHAIVPEEIGANACSWIDDYVKFSQLWSPLSFDWFHEACGLFVLSTVAARRPEFHFGKKRYTNLYIALVGRTSIHAKTSVAEIAIDTLRVAGLDWLLAPDNSTPQKLIKDMATSNLPDGYSELADDMKDRALFRALTSGQRGWFYDEFSMQIEAMMRRDGPMSDFRGILRKFDDTPHRYENATILRGNEIVLNPYLALLGNLTPADLKPFAHRGAALWNNGYLPRFGLITPPEGDFKTGRFPRGKRVIPSNLTSPIREWHDRLGLPQHSIVSRENKLYLEISSRQPEVLDVSDDVFDAYYQYLDPLREIISKSEVTDLDGNYSRFPEKALRISALFASVNNCPSIELAHWAKAQAITERWRVGLHELYRQLTESATTVVLSTEDKVLRVIRIKIDPTRREIVQSTRLEYEHVDMALDKLLQANKIKVQPNGRTESYVLVQRDLARVN